MIRSMTGYGSVETSADRYTLSVNIKSVNNRYLDISVQLPGTLGHLERRVRSAVQRLAGRGKVDVTVHFHQRDEEQHFEVDETAVRAARRALSTIAASAGVPDEPSIADLLAFDGLLSSRHEVDTSSFDDAVLAAVDEALLQWNQSRGVEGTATVADVQRQLDRLTSSLAVFVEYAPRVEAAVFEQVRTRFREVLGDDADEQRIYSEAALLMVRYGTNEEMTRLETHAQRCGELLAGSEAAGKRLDFLCQEINREINTIASKTIFPEVQNAVVEAKDAVEAIREQARNLE